MKLTLFILCLLLLNCKSSQIEKKEIYPKSGEIIFKREEVITNNALFQKSLESFSQLAQNSLKEIYIRDKKEMGEVVDEEELNMMLTLSKQSIISMFSKRRKTGKMYHKFQDSLIISYSDAKGKLIEDYSVINRTKGTYYNLVKKDSSTIYRRNSPYNYKPEENILIKEFRNSTKNINGINCFKILITVDESDSMGDFSDLLRDAKNTITLFVTDKIKSKYHPYFKYKSVLENYYPLEIVEENNFMIGHKVKYSLVKLELKD